MIGDLKIGEISNNTKVPCISCKMILYTMKELAIKNYRPFYMCEYCWGIVVEDLI